jgi:hypothetical protein
MLLQVCTVVWNGKVVRILSRQIKFTFKLFMRVKKIKARKKSSQKVDFLYFN